MLLLNIDHVPGKEIEALGLVKGAVVQSKHFGKDFLEPKMSLRLVKEPENEYDREAIRVEIPGLGKIGYVANSPYTVQGESISAGRLYDKIGDTAVATVKFVLAKGVLCKVKHLMPEDKI